MQGLRQGSPGRGRFTAPHGRRCFGTGALYPFARQFGSRVVPRNPLISFRCQAGKGEMKRTSRNYLRVYQSSTTSGADAARPQSTLRTFSLRRSCNRRLSYQEPKRTSKPRMKTASSIKGLSPKGVNIAVIRMRKNHVRSYTHRQELHTRPAYTVTDCEGYKHGRAVGLRTNPALLVRPCTVTSLPKP